MVTRCLLAQDKLFNVGQSQAGHRFNRKCRGVDTDGKRLADPPPTGAIYRLYTFAHLSKSTNHCKEHGVKALAKARWCLLARLSRDHPTHFGQFSLGQACKNVRRRNISFARSFQTVPYTGPDKLQGSSTSDTIPIPAICVYTLKHIQ